MSIGTAALTSVIVELVRSADWAGGVVLVNGHGGNRDAVIAAARQLRGEGREPLVWWPRVAGGDAHAGATETSLLLTVRPDLVHLERAEIGATAPVDELLPAAVRAVLDTSGADEVNVIGYCYGGLLSLLLGAAHPELPVAALITMATPVDFD